MKNLNSITEKISKKDQQVLVNDPSKLLADFFHGEVIQIDEESIYDT
tara:strand:+ start:503 stop:643 length:141 start_codon:yes stop_codon:yes gene_type:complete